MYLCLRWLRRSWQPTKCPRRKTNNAIGPLRVRHLLPELMPSIQPLLRPQPEHRRRSSSLPNPRPSPTSASPLSSPDPQQQLTTKFPLNTQTQMHNLGQRHPIFELPKSLVVTMKVAGRNFGVRRRRKRRWWYGFCWATEMEWSKCRENEMWTQSRLPKLKKKTFPGLWRVRHNPSQKYDGLWWIRHNPWQLFYLWPIFRHKIRNCPSQIFLYSRAPAIPSQISLVRHKMWRK